MIKEVAWNLFKNTGRVDVFMELKKLENIEEKLRAESNGNSKDERNNNFRK